MESHPDPAIKRQLSPHVFAWITLAMWSINSPFIRSAAQSFSGLSLSLYRCAIASMVAIVIGCIQKIGLPKLRDVPFFLLAGGLLNAGYIVTLALGLKTVPVATYSVISAASPVIIVLLCRILYKESIGPIRWVSMIIEFSGIALIGLLSAGHSVSLGILYLIVSAVAYAMYCVAQRRPRGYSPVQFATYSIVACTVLLSFNLPLLVRETAAADPARAGSPREYTFRELPGDESFNRKIERLFGEVPHGEDQLEDLRGHVMEILDAMISDIEELADNTGKKLDELGDFERNRELGDLVMANLHLIAPGVSAITVEDFHQADARCVIGIDPDLSGPENAELFYEKAKKGKRTAAYLAEETKRISAELGRLAALRARAAVETDPETLRSLIPPRAARQAREKQGAAGSREKATPGLTFRSGGFTILVGRTAAENDELLRKHVRGNDVWLHARDFPGGYVFIKGARDKSVPLEVLLDAGALAIHFSKGRAGGKGEVYYTFVKYLRRAKDAKKGTVLPTQEKNISVRADEARIRRLTGGEDFT